MEEEPIPRNAIAELEAIYAKKKNGAIPIVSQQPQQKPVITITQKEPTLPLPPAPPEEPGPPVATVQNAPAAPMSFDSMFAKILDRRMKKIDEEAAAKKRLMEDKLLDKFENFIESIANDSPVANQPLPQLAPQPQPIQQTRPVNSEEEPLPPGKIFRAKTPQKTVKLTSGSKPWPRKWLYTLLILGVVIAFLGGILASRGLPFSTQNMGSVGFMYTTGVGVYADSGCSMNVTSISWGTLYLGSSITKTAYVKNSGSANVTLSMATTGWTPTSVSQYISFAWNDGDIVLAPGQVIPATFTLTVAKDVPPSAGGNFAFSILVTGQGT